MDAQELNKLIDRISLTGPGGVDKIKKILKQFSGNDDEAAKAVQDLITESENTEYVIAQALNNLNARIEVLEARPATKMHVLEVLDVGTNLTADEALDLLKLDGERPSIEQIGTLNPAGLILKQGDFFFGITRFYYDSLESSIFIQAGQFMDADSEYDYWEIEIKESGTYSSISYYSL